MQSNPEVVMSRKTTLVHTSLLTAVLVFGGCSKGSGLRNAGGTPSTAAGGNGGSHSTAGAGGVVGASGAQAAGGGSVTGGSTSAGGTTATGGRTASTSSTGGVTVTGGSSALAGSGGASTWPRGGSASGGAPSSGVTAGTSQPLDADTGDGGIVSSGYCECDSPKLTYQGQTVTPGVTDYRSNIAMDCCNGSGVNLHASAWLGFDVTVELICRSTSVRRQSTRWAGRRLGHARLYARAVTPSPQ